MEGESASGSRFALLGDQPHAGRDDPLGFESVVEDLATLIMRSRASSPFTLGIEAAWGMGKSTLMWRLHARMDEEAGVRAVMFNAWTADNGTVLEGLIKTVLNQLDANVLRRALRNRKLMRWSRVLLRLGAGYVGLGRVVDTLWEEVGADPKARNELRDLVGEAVSAWRDQQSSSTGDRLLCVFIDDLDRCSPEGVLDVFEAMKLYLDVKGIVFVVGYDQDIVSDLILERKGYSSEAIKSRDYLEKFIQIVYRIPRANPKRAYRLIESLLDASGTKGLFGVTERKIMVEGSAANPRRIKRFVNSFVLAYGLDPRWREFEPEALVRLQLLQMYFREFAALLEQPATDDPIADFLRYRETRAILRGHNEMDRDAARALLEPVGLSIGADENFSSALQRLEESTQVAFAAVVDSGDFISLAESIAAAADWPDLRQALAQGILRPIPEPDRSDEARGEGRFSGLEVLWVDDEMPQNLPIVESLQAEGASIVTAAESTDDMRVALRRGPRFDVLVSDIARGDNPNEGLDAIEALVAEEVPLPQVVFFAFRITQARLRRAEALGATITNSQSELLGVLAAAAVQRRRQDHLRSAPGASSPPEPPESSS